MFDIIGKRRWFYALSLALTIPGLILLILTPFTDLGLKFTIDFTGGTRWVIQFEDRAVTPDQVEGVFVDNGYDATVTTTEDGFLDIRTEQIVGLIEAPEPAPSASPDASGSPGASGSPAASASAAASASPEPSASASPDASGSPGPSGSPAPGASPSPAPPSGNTKIPTEGELGQLATALQDELGPIAEQRTLTSIGAVVSGDLIRQALVLIVVGSLGIVTWMTYRFRDVRFGATALISLLHDVVVVLGAFAIFGTIADVHIDALFVTAMLTIIGFSVHDTIVVFDRVRENRARHAGEPFEEIVNHSVLQTVGRSVTTSFTVLVTLLALFLFGGDAITDFILALLIGIIIGTYSSVFVAAPLLVDWVAWEDRRHGRIPTSRSPRVRRAAS